MYAGKENIETTRSSSNVLAEIHPKENAMCKSDSDSPMTTGVCSDKAEVSAFAWHTERALQTQRSLSHQLDTLGNVVKPEPKKNPAPFNFNPTTDKPGCFKFGPNFPPTSKPVYMKVESENNGHTFGVQSFYHQATYPSRPDYYQRHWETMAMANGQHTDSFRDPQLNQQNWTLPSPWQYPFAYHTQQGYFPYNTVNNSFPVGQIRSSVVGTDQARERSQMQEINKRVGSNLDPLQFAVPLSVIQQPHWAHQPSVGRADSQTQKWTVVKHEDTGSSTGSTMEENVTPPLKENIINIKQENTTTPKEKTTPLLQENIVPTLQQIWPPQDEKFGCKTCGKEFKVKSLYQSHLQDHNKGFTQVDDMLYRCDTCDREFATTTSILYHLRIHNRLRCPDCNFVCSKKKVMSKHVCRSKKTKTGQGSKKLKLNTQKQTIVKEESNEQENEPQHLQKDAIQTEDATPQDTTPTLTHQKSNPPAQELEEKFACKTCGKEFKVKSLYNSHVQDHINGFTQSDTTTYKCDTCDREFTTPTAVMYHLRIHKMLRCPECNFSCSKKKVLERHVCRFKKAKTGRCQTCTATFPTRSQLNKHYAQNRDHLPIACPWEDCTLRFEHPSDLAKHQVVHTGESRYICEYCGQQFKHANNLKVHIRIHTDEKPFRCDKCDYSGRQQHALDWHNRSHHGIPIPKRSKVDEGSSNLGSPVLEGSKVNVNSNDLGSPVSEGSKDNVNSNNLGSPVSEGSKVNVNSDDLGSPVSEGSKVNVNSDDLGSPVSEGSKDNVNSMDLGSSVKVKLDTAAN